MDHRWRAKECEVSREKDEEAGAGPVHQTIIESHGLMMPSHHRVRPAAFILWNVRQSDIVRNREVRAQDGKTGRRRVHGSKITYSLYLSLIVDHAGLRTWILNLGQLLLLHLGRKVRSSGSSPSPRYIRHVSTPHLPSDWLEPSYISSL
jgi:hypothetical protein